MVSSVPRRCSFKGSSPSPTEPSRGIKLSACVYGVGVLEVAFLVDRDSESLAAPCGWVVDGMADGAFSARELGFSLDNYGGSLIPCMVSTN
jgi:hypothetical protein